MTRDCCNGDGVATIANLKQHWKLQVQVATGGEDQIDKMSAITVKAL
jgi:hypothetical protein